ncbi:MAG: hypothetical protein IH991_01245 [Planctomycetes bacterium]|nr:hypothetical protein [Planctomycetota bacterium]
MKATEIQTDHFYVNESKGLVREITDVRDNGYVEYFSYWLSDGVPDGILGVCQKRTLATWASREATVDEVAGLKRSEARQRVYARDQDLLVQLAESMPSQGGDDPFEPHFPDGFTIWDEANALVAWAFRNGSLEDLHAGKRSPLLDDPALSRITDEEMKDLMMNACRQLAKFLELKAADPVKYEREIKSYKFRYCHEWER